MWISFEPRTWTWTCGSIFSSRPSPARSRCEFKRLDPRSTQLVLDTKGLMILDVTAKGHGRPRAPRIKIKRSGSAVRFIWKSRIRFSAARWSLTCRPRRRAPSRSRSTTKLRDTSAALQWLTEKQTSRHKPFLYTESEPISARTWIPLQDTPQIRAPYKAKIHTDEQLRAVMSAENDPKAKTAMALARDYTFVMPQAVPSYLIALAVGDLEFQETGPRTGVYAEKSMIKAAAKEFADTEAMIQANEKMFGPYRWSRYDILVMPPSFPEGGMGNPRLSFITPTVIAGDKSLVSEIAHELAHSWAGNLVGNATWRDFWLNAGFTDYVESRIMTAVYGEPRASMEAVLGLKSLHADLHETQTRRPNPCHRSARPRSRRRPLDDSLREGPAVLELSRREIRPRTLRCLLARLFRPFRIPERQQRTVHAYLQENLLDRFPGIVTRAQVNAWVLSPGLPADAVLPVTNLFQPVDAARDAWLGGKLPGERNRRGLGGAAMAVFSRWHAAPP